MKRTRIKYTTYYAGGMENVKKKEMVDHREELEIGLKSPDLFAYNPIRQEAEKVGTNPGKNCYLYKNLSIKDFML